MTADADLGALLVVDALWLELENQTVGLLASPVPAAPCRHFPQAEPAVVLGSGVEYEVQLEVNGLDRESQAVLLALLRRREELRPELPHGLRERQPGLFVD